MDLKIVEVLKYDKKHLQSVVKRKCGEKDVKLVNSIFNNLFKTLQDEEVEDPDEIIQQPKTRKTATDQVHINNCLLIIN